MKKTVFTLLLFVTLAAYLIIQDDSSKKNTQSEPVLNLGSSNFDASLERLKGNKETSFIVSEPAVTNNKDITVNALTVLPKEQPFALKEIITPDELWEQQFKNAIFDELPAIPPDFPAVSEEMRKSEEAYFSSSRPESPLEDDLIAGGFSFDELPASLGVTDVMPLELQESEELFRIRKIEGYDDFVSESLVDPLTGLSYQEMKDRGDELPATEANSPIN